MPLWTAALLVSAVPLIAGAGATLLWGRPTKRGPGPAGLVVHSLTRRSPIDCSSVAPRTLERALRLLIENGCSFVRVADRGGEYPPHPRVALTFDDGLEDCYTKALPILTALDIRATFFPIAACVGTESSAADVYGTVRYLSPRQLRELADRGHEIGSHGMTHADLTLLDKSALREELRRSRATLEDLIGRPVTSISFPFGSCNQRVWDTARECGYRAAAVYGVPSRCPDALPVRGVYAFDTAEQIAEKAVAHHGIHTSLANAHIMPHFARGTPLWRFRRSYRLVCAAR